ncbi:MAG: ATP-binding protein [Bacteroidales bacterium]|nr:ATP-binding protein [Bacteroidales bacterium]
MKSQKYIPNNEVFAMTGDGGGNHLVDYIIDSHEDSVILCRRENFRIIALNLAATQLLQATKSEAMLHCLLDYIPVEIPQEYINEIESLTDTDRRVLEYILNSRDDAAYNIKVSTLMGNYMFIIKNVTRKNENIEESNFRMLFENMSSGFIFLKAISDDEGNVSNHQILDVNSTFEILFNKEKNEVVGHSINDVLKGFDDNWIKILAKSAKTGYSYSGTYHHEETNKHFEVRTYSPRKGFSAAVFNDIKQEMEIRNDLMIKNEISKAFALGHDASVYNVVLDLVLKNSSSQYGFIGYVSGNSVVCFARKDNKLPITLDNHGNEYFPIVEGTTIGKSFVAKEQILDRNIDGHDTVLATPVINEEGTIIGFIGSADSTKGFNSKAKNFVKSLADYISPLMASEIKERNYKMRLVEEKERAEANERLKTSFLANISHEIRTPMNGICGFSELLAKSDNLSDKQRKFVDFISKSTKQLLHIVEDIMDMSKLQTNQTKVNLSQVNINKMMSEIHTELLSQATEKRIELNSYPTLGDQESTMSTDYYKLKKIISCLVSNGIKFTNVGGVSYGYNVDGGYITFFVKDTGIGIRKELHDGIFSSFRQAENAMERKYNGVGVGLSISKGFVDLLDGEITLDSAPNEGSTFYVKFKFTQA